MTPTRRSNIWLRGLGFEPEPCTWYEKFPGMRIGLRKDLCGCLDALVFVGPEDHLFTGRDEAISGPCIVGLQFTDDTDHAKRRAKVLTSPSAKRFMEAGGRIVVFSWGLRGARGKRKTWTARIEDVRPCRKETTP